MPRCFKKRPPAPPQWYVMRPSYQSGEASEREGPYSRAGIAQMVKEGTLGESDLVWTNECIFPNTKRPSNLIKKVLKKKVTRQVGWKRYDQLPGPVRKLVEAEGYKVPDRRAAGGSGQDAQPPPPPPPPAGGHPAPPTGYPAPPPPQGGGMQQQGGPPYGHPGSRV